MGFDQHTASSCCLPLHQPGPQKSPQTRKPSGAMEPRVVDATPVHGVAELDCSSEPPHAQQATPACTPPTA